VWVRCMNLSNQASVPAAKWVPQISRWVRKYLILSMLQLCSELPPPQYHDFVTRGREIDLPRPRRSSYDHEASSHNPGRWCLPHPPYIRLPLSDEICLLEDSVTLPRATGQS